MTSVADRTSPVLRGKWVIEVLLGTPPPPPPPNVPTLEETKAAHGAQLLSVRERMEVHRANPPCQSCHRVIDPIGLALENFDVVGAWRISDGGVRRSTRRASSTTARRSTGRPACARRSSSARTSSCATFTENLMAYGLGRRVESYDMPTIREIVRDAGASQNHFSSFVLGIVKSPAFRMSRAERRRSTAYGRPRLTSRLRRTRGDRHVSDRRSTSRAAPSCAAWARPSRCRSSTRWCRRGTLLAKTAAAGKTRLACIEMVHGAAGSTADRPGEEPVVAGGRRAQLRSVAEQPVAARAVPRLPDDRQQHRRAQGAEAFEPKEIGGDHFRSSAVFLTQMHPKQTEGSDVHGRHLARSALRAAVRAGHADSVDAAVHRERRPGGRLRLRLRVRLHRHDQLGDADRAAADDPRSARGVRSAVRRRRDAGAARGQPPHRSQHPRLDHRRSGAHRAAALGPDDRAPARSVPDDIREIERRIQRVEAHNAQRRAARSAGRADRRARLVRASTSS